MNTIVKKYQSIFVLDVFNCFGSNNYIYFELNFLCLFCNPRIAKILTFQIHADYRYYNDYLEFKITNNE